MKRGMHRKYTIDENYFDVVDTEEKAYWLGFITADGGLSDGNLNITLSKKDAEHPVKFAKSIKSSAPVRFVSKKMKILKQKAKIYHFCFIRVCSQKFINSLNNLGVGQRKSLVSTAWHSDDTHLMAAYWRGLIDGDGWVCYKMKSKNRKNYCSIGLCGTWDIVNNFANFIETECGLNVKPQKHGKIFQISFGGTFAPQKVAKLIYGNANIYLDRKYRIAQKLMLETFPKHKFGARKDITNEMVLESYNLTKSTKKTAKQFKMDPGTISDRLKSMGVKLRTSRWK